MNKNTLSYPYLLLSITVFLLFSTSACTQNPEYVGGASRLTQLKGLPSHYSAESIEGWVVDAETKTPLEDVIVVALWPLYETWDNGSVAFAEHIEVMEAVTDVEGRYYFPAWGPLERPGETYLRRGARLYLFKEEYRYKSLRNDFTTGDDNRYEAIHRSDWDGKTVELEKFEGSLEEYAKHIGPLDGALGNLTEDGCKWKKTPRIFTAFSKYKELYRKHNIRHTLTHWDYLFKKGQCGDKQKFLKELNP